MLYGNAIVGQSGGPTAAINATLAGVIRGLFECEYIKNAYGAFNGVEGMLEERMCDLRKVFDSEEKLVTLENTPSSALGSCPRASATKSTSSCSRYSRNTIFATFSTSAEMIRWTRWQSCRHMPHAPIFPSA